ncbi:MAG TPA: hypothetical protein VN549_08940 [Negativicutes bacterium]|nr:hypothetical protein [Negativicutes bacterium]
MTQAELMTVLESTGLPVAYGEFIDIAPPPPFITYQNPGSNDLFADNHNYVDIQEYQVELYTIKKEPETEKLLIDKFKELHIPYERFESPVRVDGMIQNVYTIQAIGG